MCNAFVGNRLILSKPTNALAGWHWQLIQFAVPSADEYENYTADTNKQQCE